MHRTFSGCHITVEAWMQLYVSYLKPICFSTSVVFNIHSWAFWTMVCSTISRYLGSKNGKHIKFHLLQQCIPLVGSLIFGSICKAQAHTRIIHLDQANVEDDIALLAICSVNLELYVPFIYTELCINLIFMHRRWNLHHSINNQSLVLSATYKSRRLNSCGNLTFCLGLPLPKSHDTDKCICLCQNATSECI